MYISNVSKKTKSGISRCKLLVEAFRDKNGKPTHRTILNLSKLPAAVENAIEYIFKKKADKKTPAYLEDVIQTENKSLGEVQVLHKLAVKLGMVKVLGKYLKKDVMVLILAMVINRISKPKSRYSLVEWLKTTYLPEIFGKDLKEFHHSKLYQALKKLNLVQDQIEQDLFKETKKREKKLTLILYDITSSYVEGDQNELAEFGYNRDGKKGKKQVVIGLIATPEGRPVSVEVLSGNTPDKNTLISRVNSLKEKFGLKEIIYTFDRGMGDNKKLIKLQKDNIKYLTAINRQEISRLLKEKTLQPGLFDKEISEVIDGGVRYVICKSDQNSRSKNTRKKLLEKTVERLEKIQKSILNKRLKDPKKIAVRVDKSLTKYKMKKYFKIEFSDNTFTFELDQEKIAKAELLDQIYILKTTATQKDLTTEKVQESYKNLSIIEDDFRQLKSLLEIRPINHRKEETVKAHIFICFLSLYIRRELEIKLKEHFKETKQTFSSVLTELREIRQSKLVTNIIGQQKKVAIPILNKLNEVQEDILKKLKMRIKPLPLSTYFEEEIPLCSK